MSALNTYNALKQLSRLHVVRIFEEAAHYKVDSTLTTHQTRHPSLKSVKSYHKKPSQNADTLPLRPDSELEAFSRYHTGGCLAALTFRTAAFTNCPNEVFLSYLLRLLS